MELECRDVKTSLMRLIAVLNELDIELLSLETIEPNLERVFLHLTGHAAARLRPPHASRHARACWSGRWPRKTLRLLLRDPRAMVVLLAMPLIFILVLGVSLGEGFGQKPDDRLRISVVDLDQPFYGSRRRDGPLHWSKTVERDLAQTAGIRVEVIPSLAEAEELVRNGTAGGRAGVWARSSASR